MTLDTYTAGIWIDTNLDGSIGDQIKQFFDCCGGTGTLGCFAKDKNGKTVLLTCQHVLFPRNVAPDNAGVYQPRFSSCCSGDLIAKPVIDPAQVVNGKYAGGYRAAPDFIQVKVNYHGVTVDPNQVKNPYLPTVTVTDCAAALLNPGLKFQNVWRYKDGKGVQQNIPLKGAIVDSVELGCVPGPPLGTRPSHEQYVRAYSDRLGRVVYGTLASLPGKQVQGPFDDPQRILFPNGVGDPTLGPALARSLMFIPRPDEDANKSYEIQYDDWNGKGPDHGDSGTMVINSDNQIIGMICASVKPKEIFTDTSSKELSAISNISLVSPIREVVAQLGVTIPSDPNGWSGTAAAEGARVFVPGMRDDDDESGRQRGLARLRDGLRATRRGQLILGKIGQHGRELRFMFNRVRELAVAWQRMRGPAYLHHGTQSVLRPGHAIPVMIDGVSRRDLVEALLPIIEKHASPRLARDLALYRVWAEFTLLDLRAVDDVIEAIQ